MVDEVMSISKQEISQQKFNEKLALNQNKYHTWLNTKVKDMLPDKNFSKVGNGYLINRIEDNLSNRYLYYD